MPRRKIPISFIGNRRTRALTFAKRKDGLMKKARELATLCDVPVAVVCAGPDGGATVEWASEGGIFDRYRALPAGTRAAHTHVKYLGDQLGKEKAKLARQRQDGPDELAPSGEVLNDMTLDELQELLESVDAALRATGERRKALGLPDDDDADVDRNEQAASDASSAVVSLGHGVPCAGSNFVDLDGYQMRAPGNGSINNGRLEQDTWDALRHYNAGMVQPRTGYNFHGMGGYQLPMPGNGSNDHGRLALGGFQPRNAVVQPGYGGFQCTDSRYVGMDGYQMQAPGNGNVNHGCPNLAMWGTEESCNAIVPVGYPSMYVGGNCVDTLAEYPALSTGDNFINTPIGFGIRDDFMNVDFYETQISADDFQCSGTSQNSSSVEQLHYLSDLAEGMRFGSRDTQLQLWKN